MAHRFIVGESPAAALEVLRGLWQRGVASTVDLLGEATVTEAEADNYARRCTEALEEIAREAARWPERPVLERDRAGRLPRANVSVKVSALTPLLRPDAPERGREDAAGRLRPLLRRAKELDAHIHIDMESLDSREAVLELVLGLLREDEFRQGPSAGLVLQAYLRDSPEQLTTILEWARSCPRTPPLQIRLVKGAYWDHELVEARQHGWPTHGSSCAWRSARTTCARSRMRSPSAGRLAARIRTWSSRSCGDLATSFRTRSRPAACGCARTALSATS
jgi:RHH-type proline utilization regulon transcriptional repressor/proline dehydrogenase/delta 1-pyrroline-5-carboxylate dehydrogenase